jgi:ribosomal-protein-serine acetyltransferase
MIPTFNKKSRLTKGKNWNINGIKCLANQFKLLSLKMFFREIDRDIKLSLSIPQYAEEIFQLIDKNREFLKQWLPWLNSVQKISNTKEFIELQLLKFQQGEALHITIFYRDKIVGVVGFNQIDRFNSIGYIGYWLGEEYNHKGIMTKSVAELIEIGRSYYALNRFDIRCAVENNRSRAIPERLGFQNEGIIRHAEKVYDKYLDHVVYGLLKNDSF